MTGHEGSSRRSIEVAPLQSHGSLYGFMLLGRWPDDTVEWAEFLVLAVRMAAVPGPAAASSTVFRVREELPDDPQPGAVGLVGGRGLAGGRQPAAAGPVRGDDPALAARPAPAAEHAADRWPTTTSRPVACSCPGSRTSASTTGPPGSQADVDGTVTQLVSRSGVDPAGNADTAALALLLAAGGPVRPGSRRPARTEVPLAPPEETLTPSVDLALTPVGSQRFLGP